MRLNAGRILLNGLGYTVNKGLCGMAVGNSGTYRAHGTEHVVKKLDEHHHQSRAFFSYTDSDTEHCDIKYTVENERGKIAEDCDGFGGGTAAVLGGFELNIALVEDLERLLFGAEALYDYKSVEQILDLVNKSAVLL